MDKIVVLIPCYNESKTIKKVIEDVKNKIENAKIYVYDNNSTDHTDLIARNAGAIVRYEKKQGKGNVIRTMFREINAECYIIVDGDDTYSLSNLNQMCNLILNENIDMVIGDRLSSNYFKENNRLFHNFGNRLVRKIINTIYKSDIKDVMTGYRAFSYRFVKTFPILSKNFEVETEMTIHTLDNNLNYETLPVEYKNRPIGSNSKLNTYYDGFSVLKTIISLYKNYKPLSFFSIISIFLILIGLVFFLPVIIEYVNTGLVPKMPSFLASIFFFISSIQSFFCGLILQTIVKKNKQDFEIKLNEYTDKFNVYKEFYNNSLKNKNNIK